MSHIDILILDLFVDKISSPNTDTVIVDSQELRVWTIVEGDLVGSIGTYWVSTKCFTSGNL